MKSADGQSIDYPELQKLKEISSPGEILNLTQKFFQSASSTGAKFHDKPLEGYVVADFSNVLAGPNCGRMLCELGATVYKVNIFGKGEKIPSLKLAKLFCLNPPNCSASYILRRPQNFVKSSPYF